MDTNAWWYIGGQWVHPDKATISINDIAVLRGYSVFESLRTYDRRPFHLDLHLTRLYRSARLIEMEIPWSSEQIAEIVREIIACVIRIGMLRFDCWLLVVKVKTVFCPPANRCW